uniref:Uncharacterized protein n=1 Tax=viral metagenome TaxID=1070528 RepID=A0A6M3KGF4_9ZZZZ
MYLAGTNRIIDTGDTYFAEISKDNIAGSKVAIKFLQRDTILNLPVYDGKPLKARINFARWVVGCPNCGNAEYAFEDKLFLCSQCKNSDIQGRVRKVKMPNNRKQIEDALKNRFIKNRHWFPEETITDLEDENKKHGVK